jgi:predicted MFS family arabinose efflux permease
VCVLSSLVLYAVLFLAPVYLQSIQHRPTSVAGLAMLAPGLVMGVSSPLGDRVVERYSVRVAVIAGMLLLAVTTAAMVALDAATPVWITTLLLCGRGMAIGLTAQPLVLSLLGGLAPERAPDGNTLFSVAQRLAGSFGIALLATYFAARTAASGSALTALHESVLILAVVALFGALAAGRLVTREPASASA